MIRRCLKPKLLLTLLSSIGLNWACGDINEVPKKMPHVIPKPEISDELAKLGRLQVEHSSAVMTDGSSCRGGGGCASL